MSVKKSSAWCVVKKCNNILEKRHFFLFPKEYDRWLQWIQACERFDLEVMGPEYAHRNYRLCHLHFEEKWYKIGKSRAHLHPDAIPTIFFGKINTSVTTPVTFEDVENMIETDGEEETNSNMQSSNAILDTNMDTDAEIAILNTSSSTHLTIVKEIPRKKKFKKRNCKLKAENRILRERIRWLQTKITNLENTNKSKEESIEHETHRQLDWLKNYRIRALEDHIEKLQIKSIRKSSDIKKRVNSNWK